MVGTAETIELAGAVAAYHERRGNPVALRRAFQAASLIVPVTSDDALLTLIDRGLRWVCACTSVATLARFAVARGEGEHVWHHRRATGAELMGLPLRAGVALDLAGPRPMLFPPSVLCEGPR